MNRDPWADVARSSSSSTVSAKRIGADIPWNFFWAKDSDGKFMLILRHSLDAAPTGKLPKLKGIQLDLLSDEDQHQRVLAFRLSDSTQRDIFLTLCEDIVAIAAVASTERDAVATALKRTWRWHHLLRGGSDQRLSEEEQKGLIGELLALENLFFPNLSLPAAIGAWRGPFGDPKDFQVGLQAVETKTHRGGATPTVAISSEHQLDDVNLERLFLVVLPVNRAAPESTGGFSVTDLATQVQKLITQRDPGSLESFESTLAATGFRWEDDYTDTHWLAGAWSFYRVADGFPRITTRDAKLGVRHVTYSLALDACEPFRVADSEINSALRGG